MHLGTVPHGYRRPARSEFRGVKSNLNGQVPNKHDGGKYMNAPRHAHTRTHAHTHACTHARTCTRSTPKTWSCQGQCPRYRSKPSPLDKACHPQIFYSTLVRVDSRRSLRRVKRAPSPVHAVKRGPKPAFSYARWVLVGNATRVIIAPGHQSV